MTRVIGAILLVFGLVAGVVLLLAPFGKAPLEDGAAMWVAFPLGCVGGHVLLMMKANRSRMALASTLVGGILLSLGLAATVAQFLVSGGVLAAAENTFSLWYVASGGFVLGGVAWSLRGAGRETPSAS